MHNQDSQKDAFQKFPQTPHLGSSRIQQAEISVVPALADELKKILTSTEDKGDFYDRLRLFRRQHRDKITELETEPFKNRRLISERLTEVADALVQTAFEYTAKHMPAENGKPSYLASYQQTLPASLAILGMGRYGAGEMNYESDLDLIFIFSHVGETTGPKTVSNTEYFSKFVQRFINLLSVLTGAGRCYEIDTELRPSGNAGPIVTSFEHFQDHQMNHSQEWERMALLRARTVFLDDEFKLPLKEQTHGLAYQRPIPKDFFRTMHGIRERVIAEKSKETENRIDLKLGRGGLMDILFILQGLQLKNQMVFPDLRQRNSFTLFDVLKQHTLLTPDEVHRLEDAYLHLLAVEARLQLAKRRSESILDLDAESTDLIASELKFSGKEVFKKHINELRKEVRVLYERMYVHAS